MLEIVSKVNEWNPPDITMDYVDDVVAGIVSDYDAFDWIHFIKIEPYIDLLYIPLRTKDRSEYEAYRFVFHEEYDWDSDQEEAFENRFLKSEYPVLSRSSEIDHIYEYYSTHYPGWHLKRYYTHTERLLDHIHHCMKKNTIKELLYKAGVDEIAARAPKAHEVNLLASSPSEIFDGVPNRVIRAINTEYGAKMLSDEEYREFLKTLNYKYPDVFAEPLNNAQCEYLMYLKRGELTCDEIYRLFTSSKSWLSNFWLHSQVMWFIQEEKTKAALCEKVEALNEIDPFYGKYLDTVDKDILAKLVYCLLDNREWFDREIRRANRKRNYDWQERDEEYYIRYPQTINDFCREALYMRNCLFTYLTAFVQNDTTLLFLRKADDINTPFITLEIYQDRLVQAYHRFNKDCDEDEAKWIRNYCRRHGIDCEDYAFNWIIDRH